MTDKGTSLRITIATRIFEPEPSAASFRLAALADALVKVGHKVRVDTVEPWAKAKLACDDRSRNYVVHRHRVLRDSTGYVRGYLQYMSYDLPLFWRMLWDRSSDAYIVEPPPTTGFFAMVACMLRRRQYAYYAADIWSQAAALTGAPSAIVRVLRLVETLVLRRATHVLAVSEGVVKSLAEMGVSNNVTLIGNGIDTERFQSRVAVSDDAEAPSFVYAGTASEWHGADLLVRGFAESGLAEHGATLAFIGGGSERDRLRALSEELGVKAAVSFEGVKPAEKLAPILQRCVAAIATLRPGSGYEFAFPTKLYSATAAGAPLIHVGPGPAADYVRTCVDGESLGQAVDYSSSAVAESLQNAYESYRRHGLRPERRRRVQQFARDTIDIRAVAWRAVQALQWHPDRKQATP